MKWVLIVALAWAGLAQAAVESKVFTLGDADPHETEAAVKAVLSPAGKTVLLVKERKLLVQDEPTQMTLAEAIINELNAPRPNVRVEITLVEDSASLDQHVEVRGRVGGRDLSIGNRPGPTGIEIGGNNQRVTTSSLSGQFLVVQSGRSASIRVVREVPFVDYFYQYALGLGYVTGVQQTRWRDVGTQMAVAPRVRGNLIDVDLTPQITTLVDGVSGTIDCRELVTTVTVANGQSVQLGGFNRASEEFNRNFFSRGRSGGTGGGGFTLRATIF